MTRRLVWTLGVFTIAACSQVAGFESFSGDDPSDDGGTGGSVTPSGDAGLGGASFGGGPRGGAPNTPEAGRAPGGAGGTGVSQTAGTQATGTGGSSPRAGTGGASPSSGGTSSGGPSAGTGGDVELAGSGGLGEGGAVGGCDRQLLHNADFELGPSSWREDSDFAPNHPIIRPGSDASLMELGVAPQAGNQLAWLGGFPDVEDRRFESTLTQDVTIPLETAFVRMTGYIRIVTEETEPGWDGMVMELARDGSVYWQVHYWYNQDASSGWVYFDYSDADIGRLERMRGQTLTLFIQSRQDEGTPTSFFLDSLRLVATCSN